MDTLTDDDLVTLNRAATVARLLAGVAHEVNNALLVISGTAELLEDQTDAPDAVAKGLARVRSQSARAAAAIGEVLAFARGAPDARGRVNLREAAADAVALRTYAIGRAGLKVTVSAPEDRSVVVEGSRVLLLQALLNLLTNAEQALSGVPGGSIRVELGEEAGRARLRVADTGHGVPAEERTRIFEPFMTTRDRRQSSGLGLTAARRIARIHGGTLEVDVTPSGASFVLELPMA
ncbi:MAG: sensor histidine kinase [Vicinamibacterales bacterium]